MKLKLRMLRHKLILTPILCQAFWNRTLVQYPLVKNYWNYILIMGALNLIGTVPHLVLSEGMANYPYLKQLATQYTVFSLTGIIAFGFTWWGEYQMNISESAKSG